MSGFWGDRLLTVSIGHGVSVLPAAHVLLVRALLTSRGPVAKHEVLPRGRVDILAAARRTAGAGRPLNALFILMWLPMPLRWSRARLAKVRRRRSKPNGG